MSITFNHKVGQHGNQLFICVHAALIAHKKNLAIRMPANGLVTFRPTNDNVPDIKDRKQVWGHGNIDNSSSIIHANLKKGFFQHAHHYGPNIDIIHSHILDMPPIIKNTQDVVMHIRLDGFNHRGHNSHIITPAWYISILNTLNLQNAKLFIVMDSKSGHIWRKQRNDKKSYLSAFDKYDPIIVTSDARSDFEFIRSFDTIICSNSTFCWWACLLSQASTIFVPPIWESRAAKLSDIPNAQIVSQDFGYINIITMEPVKISFQ